MAYTIIRFGNDYSGAAGEVVGNVIGARTATDTQYPYTLGGVTMGLDTANAVTVQATAWQTGDALPLRGRFRIANTTARGFRIDVTPGEYRVILGTAAQSYQHNRWRINDGVGGTERFNLQVSGVTAWGGYEPSDLDQWVDQRGVVRAIGVGTSPRVPVDVLSATPTLMQFDTGIIEVLNGAFSPATFSSDLSFIAFERVEVTTPAIVSISPTSGPVGTQVTFTGTALAGTSAANVNGTAMTGIVNDSATQIRATVGAGSTTGATGLTATAGSVTGGPVFTVTVPPPPLVQNGFRLVPGTLPVSPVVGVEYVIQGEAIDTTQGNARVTTFQAPSAIFGADIGSMPDGLVVFSGDVDEPMVNGLVTWTLTFANSGVVPPVVIIPVNRRARFSASPSVPQTSGALFSVSIVGTIQTLLGNIDTAYVTPVELVMRNGDGSVIGQSVVTPVAGAFTFAAVGVRLTENVSFSEVNLGILGFEGQTQPIPVQTLQLLPSLTAASSNVPRSSAAAPVAVVQIVGPVVGGSLFLEATANGTVWSLIDFTPYVAGAVVNTAVAGFFGRVSVEGLTAVRVRRANLNVTYDSVTLTVFGG